MMQQKNIVKKKFFREMAAKIIRNGAGISMAERSVVFGVLVLSSSAGGDIM